MFSPSKRAQYTDQIASNIERMANKPHRKMFIHEYAENNKFGEPLYRLDSQDLKWKDKRNQFQARQESYIKQFSPKKRSKSQLQYDPQTSDFVAATDREHYRLKNSVHQFPKKKIVRDRLNESCSNIFASGSSTKNTNSNTATNNNNNNSNNNLNASITFWNRQRKSVSPIRNRSSSIMVDSFCQDKDRSPREEYNKNNQSVQINPNYINRYKNTNIILGINDSSPQPHDKGIRTFHEQFPTDTNIIHLVNKTSATGFNHNISYQINDRSRENSQTNARVFNLGSETTPSFHKNGIKTFFQTPSEPGKGLPNPLTGENMKKEKGIGLRMVNTSAKKQTSTFDSIYNSMSEFSPEKNVGIKCKINNSNQSKFNPIVMFDTSDPNQPPTSARQGKKTFAQRQSPSPVKFLLQQNIADNSTQINNTTANNNSSVVQNNANANTHLSDQKPLNPIVHNLDSITSVNGQIQTQHHRMPKKLVDAYPKSNQPSQFNYLVYQNSSMYSEKYKDLQEKNSKGSFGQRNKSPNMKDVMYSESALKNSILTSASKHNISVNNNNMNSISQTNLNNSIMQCEQQNEDFNESIIQSKRKQSSQQENISDTPAKRSSQRSTQSQQQQQLSQSQILQQQSTQSQQQQQHSSSQMSVSGRSAKKYHPDKSFSGNQQSSALNLSQVKQAVKMGEIQGVKKIYDFESFKNKYR